MKIYVRPDSYKIFLALSFTSQLLFSLIFTVNLIYHLKVAELNPLQLILVGTVLEASVFLFEIPTGIVADTKSRKLSIVTGYILMGMGFITEGLFPFFLTIAFAQVLWGLGYTFTSGATQAWITDEIGEEKAGKAFVKGAQVGLLGELTAIPFSIGIGLVSVNLPIIFGGILMILFALLLIVFMQETGFKPRSPEQLSNWTALKKTLTDTMHYIKSNHILIFLLMIGVFYGLYSEGFDRLWTAHLLEDFVSPLITAANPVFFLGAVRAVLIVLSSLALEFINRRLNFSKTGCIVNMLIVCAVATVIALAGFGLIRSLNVVLVLLMVIGIMRSITAPLLDIWLNRLILEPGMRATLFSVKGQVDALGQISGGPLTGFLGNVFSIRTALAASAALLSPVVLIYGIIVRKQKNRNILTEVSSIQE